MRVITRYACELCGHEYPTQAAALFCESHPVYDAQPVAVGAWVWITAGVGNGERARVEARHLIPCQDEALAPYWHTPRLTVSFSFQCLPQRRQLLRGQYLACQEVTCASAT